MPPPVAVARRTEPLPVNPQVWRACAGPVARIPSAGSLVYYFPEGHSEQCPSPPDFSGLACDRPAVPCAVVDVVFLANPDTDEVFARIRLDPRVRLPFPSEESHGGGGAAPDVGGGSGGTATESFVKILTPSDANNGGGFSVPRCGAEAVFPPLDMKADPPVQTISVYDIHGRRWEFRHIYRGTPRRHLLTTGWSKFVNAKKLVYGDSIVFIRDPAGVLFVGLRRTQRFCGHADSPWHNMEANGLGIGEGFSRSVRGRVPASTVVEALKSTEMGQPFEVLYYPRPGAAEFVVAKESFDAAMSICWMPMMRIKMHAQPEDSSMMAWHHGMVSAVAAKKKCPWAGSPWRLLQVTWDDPDVLKRARSNLNPWEVELVSTTHQMQTPYHLVKKHRMSLGLESFGDGSGMTDGLNGLPNESTGSLRQLLGYTIFPAGVQGARHDLLFFPGVSPVMNTNQTISESLNGTEMSLRSNTVIEGMNDVNAELTMALSQQEENILDSVADQSEFPACDASKAPVRCLQLFGKIIMFGKSDADESSLEMQTQRVSSVEACSL